MNKFDEALKHLLALEPNEIRLKWVFDHVRNYALAATVMVAGFYLLKHGAIIKDSLIYLVAGAPSPTSPRFE